jgi:hypothetical protein
MVGLGVYRNRMSVRAGEAPGDLPNAGIILDKCCQFTTLCRDIDLT